MMQCPKILLQVLMGKKVYVSNINHVRSRIFINKVKMYDGSTNWRADFHRFKGSTYAQVLKSKIRVSNNP